MTRDTYPDDDEPQLDDGPWVDEALAMFFDKPDPHEDEDDDR